MTDLLAVARLSGAPAAELVEQAQKRRELLARFLEALRGARSAGEAVGAMRLHGSALELLGRHDEAARLRALRAVEADFVQVEREVVELQARADQRIS